MKLTDYLKALPQYLLPGHLLSRAMLAITRVRWAPFKNAFTDWFIRRFGIDLSEAEITDPHGYPHFNAFFTRALKPGYRLPPDDADSIASPVDGTVSQLGTLGGGEIFQAKGRSYTATQLLGSAEMAALFEGGSFATVYLSPRNYHRIHMPLDGRLREMVHVPGRLFSVSPATTRVVPGLFARNERVVSLFDTAAGPMALVKVGAIFVSGIETVWAGLITPPAGRILRRWHYDGEQAISLDRGREMGRFNMGSTVILLFARDAVQWDHTLGHDTQLRMGQSLGRVAV